MDRIDYRENARGRSPHKIKPKQKDVDETIGPPIPTFKLGDGTIGKSGPDVYLKNGEESG